MPSAASFLRVVRVWHWRDSVLRFWVYVISATAASMSNLVATRPNHHERTTAAAAVRTWQTVSAEFFPPQLLMHLRQEQVAGSRDRLMALQPHIRSPLKVVEAQLRLLILEAAFHAPA